jgi:hypothetical protein
VDTGSGLTRSSLPRLWTALPPPPPGVKRPVLEADHTSIIVSGLGIKGAILPLPMMSTWLAIGAYLPFFLNLSRHCSVGIATVRSGGRMAVGARVSATVRIGLGAFAQPPVNGHRVSFPVVKRPGFGVEHPHPSSSKVKESRTVPLRLHDLF